MTGEINNRGPNVTPVASRRHAESVLSVIQQFDRVNIANKYWTAFNEIERFGIPERVIASGLVLALDEENTSAVFMLTIWGERELRRYQNQEMENVERGTDGGDPG